MMPLIKIGPLALSSFGLTVLIALWTGSWAIDRLAQRRGLPEGLPGALAPLLVVAGLIGARLWYVLFNLDLYAAQPALIGQLSFGAFAFPGALLAGWLVLNFYARLCRSPAAQWSDLLAQVLPWGQALGMIGLVLSGEAYGRPSELPWALPLLGVSRHPSQIYEALALAGLGLWLWRLTRLQPAPGILTAHYLAGYGALRLLLEPLRGDSLLIGTVRTAQVFGLALLLGALYWLWWRVPAAQSEGSRYHDDA
ncbi:MAG: prolipoprotein diacylglyceryl transferase [Herpetosiphonaceae bacterium]|nr:MAG: prolipoprotein diacylglyceryl transferase [Herpetosiphonaceae bacterium]